MRIERISGAILILLSGVLLLMAAYFGGFQKTSAQFSRSSKSLFQNSKLPIAPMFLQIFQYLWFLLQIPENLQNLIWRQVHAGAVVFNDLVLCRVG